MGIKRVWFGNVYKMYLIINVMDAGTRETMYFIMRSLEHASNVGRPDLVLGLSRVLAEVGYHGFDRSVEVLENGPLEGRGHAIEDAFMYRWLVRTYCQDSERMNHLLHLARRRVEGLVPVKWLGVKDS